MKARTKIATISAALSILLIAIAIIASVSEKKEETRQEALEQTFSIEETESESTVAAESKVLEMTETEKIETVGAKDQDNEEYVSEASRKVSEMQKENNSIYGWIQVEDTEISYPVMEGEAEYWLHHNSEGEKSSYGSIYIEPYSSEQITFISGHAMKDGKMFGALNKKQEALIGEEVRMITPEQDKTLHVKKLIKASGTDSDLINAINTDDFAEYAGIEGPAVVMMCCEYSVSNGRLFVICQ